MDLVTSGRCVWALRKKLTGTPLTSSPDLPGLEERPYLLFLVPVTFSVVVPGRNRGLRHQTEAAGEIVRRQNWGVRSDPSVGSEPF